MAEMSGRGAGGWILLLLFIHLVVVNSSGGKYLVAANISDNKHCVFTFRNTTVDASCVLRNSE